MSDRALIVNGDDFGISTATNNAILRAHREGILTSASLMVNGAAFEEAVTLAREHPSLSVGIHLVLVLGRPTLPPGEIPQLVNRRGDFADHPVRAGMAFFFFRSLREQIRKELDAQFRKFLSTGLPLDHVNGHLNIHVHPTVLEIVIELAARHRVKKIRLPREELLLNLRLDSNGWHRKVVQWAVFELLSLNASRRLKGGGFRMPDRAYGLLQTGRMNESYLLGLLERMGDGTCEISFHLGEAAEWPAFYDSRGELSALLSKGLRERIEASGRRLVSYRSL